MKNPPDDILHMVRSLPLQRIILNLDPNQYKQGKNVSYLSPEIKYVQAGSLLKPAAILYNRHDYKPEDSDHGTGKTAELFSLSLSAAVTGKNRSMNCMTV